MKRLQIMIEEDLDAGLEREAVREGVSKAALVRRYIRAGMQPLPPLEEDPLFRLAGSADFEPADVDEVVYG